MKILNLSLKRSSLSALNTRRTIWKRALLRKFIHATNFDFFLISFRENFVVATRRNAFCLSHTLETSATEGISIMAARYLVLV